VDAVRGITFVIILGGIEKNITALNVRQKMLDHPTGEGRLDRSETFGK